VQGAGTHVRSLLSLRNGAQHVVVEGLEFRNAHIDFAHDGLFPGHNASGIYVEDASHVVIRDCELHGNGNGLFSAPGTVDLRVERNYLWGNGNVGRALEHNSYTETDGIVFEGNRYGPLCSGCLGNNLKDRSAGTVIRYNFIEGGNRALDLVHAQTDDEDFTMRVASTPTYVYGNVFIKIDDTTQSQVVHFGGDDDTFPETYRRTLRFYNNTVYSTRAVRTTFFHADAPAPDLDIRNCIFVTPSSSQIYLLDSSTSTGATVAIVNSYLPPTWDVSVEAALDAVVTTTGVTTGTTPGFVDGAAFDFHLVPNATVRNGGAALAAASRRCCSSTWRTWPPLRATQTARSTSARSRSATATASPWWPPTVASRPSVTAGSSPCRTAAPARTAERSPATGVAAAAAFRSAHHRPGSRWAWVSWACSRGASEGVAQRDVNRPARAAEEPSAMGRPRAVHHHQRVGLGAVPELTLVAPAENLRARHSEADVHADGAHDGVVANAAAHAQLQVVEPEALLAARVPHVGESGQPEVLADGHAQLEVGLPQARAARFAVAQALREEATVAHGPAATKAMDVRPHAQRVVGADGVSEVLAAEDRPYAKAAREHDARGQRGIRADLGEDAEVAPVAR
jgi:hypothetical protein